MKKLSLALIMLAFINANFAQTPQYIPYQAVARNSAGNLLVNQSVSLRFTIRETSGTGTIDYQETQSATTNNLGLFTVNIGNGARITGTLSGVPWGNGTPKFTQVEIDPTGGSSYTDMGASQMQSVPYALYAGNASSVPLTSGTGISVSGDQISNTGVVSLTTSGSNGAASLSGTTLNVPDYTLSGLGGIGLSALSASSPLAYNSGTGAFSVSQANTSTNGYLSSTDWNTFNNKQGAISLTTNNSSGAATFSSNTLNVPNYTLAGLGGQAALTSANAGTGISISGGVISNTGVISLANPTGSIGMTANNGSATTAMRSDATPAINAAIAPAWTGTHTFSNGTYSALFTGGSVGIGTTTPIAALQVVTPDLSGGAITTWGTGEFVVGKAGGTGGALGLGYDGTNNVGTIYSLAPNVAWKDLAFRANNFIFYYSGGTEGLRLTTTGALAVNGAANYGSTGNQLLSNGNGAPGWGALNLAGGANYVSGILPVANGGTGSSSQNWVDLTSTQTAAGAKTWTNTATFSNGTYSALFTGGSVGIGTAAPGAPLDVTGTATIGLRYLKTGTQDARISLGDNSGNVWSWSTGWATAGDYSLIHEGLDGQVIYFSHTTHYVGIGTSTPKAPLDVEINTGATTIAGNPRQYFESNFPCGYSCAGVAGDDTYIYEDNTSGSSTIAIYANGWIMTNSGFMAASDARIKNILGVSDSKDDLATLSKIEVTDYRYKDVATEGNRLNKKVIAQQVQQVYPQAVTVNSYAKVIPNIYENAMRFTATRGAVTAYLTNEVCEDKDIKVGAVCQIYLAKKGDADSPKEIKGEITSINGNEISISYPDTLQLAQYNQVFIYGTEIHDFLSVDYDAISMLNVSATQELAKQVNSLQERIRNLEAENARVSEENVMLKNAKADISDINQLQTQNNNLQKQLDELKLLMQKNNLTTQK